MMNLCKSAFLSLTLTAFSVKAQKTNIVLIMADDMGIECLESYGGQSYKTPHLTSLAENGVQFNHCYSQPYSTASRVKIMTGMYNFRNYKEYKYLNPKDFNFGKMAQKAGYKTGIFGKWHLGGDSEDNFKEKWGWDEHALWNINTSGSRYKNPAIFKNGMKIDGQGRYGPDVFCKSAQAFIRKHKKEAFFVYYPMVLPHFPFMKTPEDPTFLEKGKAGALQKDPKRFKPMVEYVDKIIGRLVKSLKAQKVYNNTVIIFTADNGTFHTVTSTKNGKPVRGQDGRMVNAGTHVPLIVNWGDEIEKGVKSDALVDFSDFFPTIAEIMNYPIPNGLKIDGVSFTRSLTNPKYSERSYVYCHFDPINVKGTSTGSKPEAGNYIRNRTHKLYGDGTLYNTVKDPNEEKALEPSSIDENIYKMLSSNLQKLEAQGGKVPVVRTEYTDKELLAIKKARNGETPEKKSKKSKKKKK